MLDSVVTRGRRQLGSWQGLQTGAQAERRTNEFIRPHCSYAWSNMPPRAPHFCCRELQKVEQWKHRRGGSRIRAESGPGELHVRKVKCVANFTLFHWWCKVAGLPELLCKQWRPFSFLANQTLQAPLKLLRGELNE